MNLGGGDTGPPPPIAEAATSQLLQGRRGWGLPTWGLLGGDDRGGDDGNSY